MPATSEFPTVASTCHHPSVYQPAAPAAESSFPRSFDSKACRDYPSSRPRPARSSPCPHQPHLYASYTCFLVILNGLSVVRIVILLFPVVSTIRPPDPIPLLQPHYRAFIALTDRSVPVLCIGTLASRFLPLALLPCHQRTGLLQFHAKACIRFTPPLRRSPSAQSSGTRQTHPSGASRPWF